VTKEGKALVPTDTGDVVSSFLESNFSEYISDTFTAEMEDKLDDIALGAREYKKTLKEFYTPFLKELKEKDKLEKATTFGDADPKYKCPKCKSGMLIKLSRGGKFLSCDRYPDCDGALTIEGFEIKPDEPIGIDPTTSLPIFVKHGRFGPYVQLGIQVKAPKKVKKSKKDKTEEAETETPAPKVFKPKMASIPKEYDPTKITLENALMFLSLPRTLGAEPKTGLPVVATTGRFGPFVAHDKNFRSIKPPLSVYTITFEEALALLAIAKKPRGFQKKKKD
ncbi:MAG: topoisomerase, partial [Patescibacteria group bacterium]|nr:topoisomerase [Patescibacteria group bacterium]